MARKVTRGFVVLIAALTYSFSLFAQDCVNEVVNSFACNEQVNVSLGADCTAEISPSTITENLIYAETSYTVEITDNNGNILAINEVGPEHHLEYLTVSVTQICTGYNCWGTIFVEDKYAPPLLCRTDEAECLLTSPEDFGFPVDALATITSNGENSYIVSDLGDCDDFTLKYRDRLEDLGCEGTYIQIIYRTWTAEDSNGNVSTCTDTISVIAGSIADITLPPHYDDMDQPAFECNDVLDTLPNGNPSTMETGSIGGINCANIITYFDDLEFSDVCGASRKILRTWNVLDWCSSEELVYDQVIKILDKTDPIILNVSDTIINTVQYRCFGRFQVEVPEVDDCSSWTYTILHKPVDESLDPYTDATNDYVTYNATNNRYTIKELPFGQSWISIYVQDDCGMETQDYFIVDVVDNQLPSPVCDTHTTISLDNENTAELYASSLDDGSLDNCGIALLEVRRMTDMCGIIGNTSFGEYVEFCCADVGEISLVELRAEDRSGNVNTCMIEVRIADELPPLFKNCPSDITIDCSLDYQDLTITGNADAYDNCNFELSHLDVGNLSNCGLGTITRKFTAKDDHGNSSDCSQDIKITSDDEITISGIVWPDDRDEKGCLEDDFGPHITGEPKVTSTGCAQVWVDYDDEIFYSLDNKCSKILRTWVVTNECSAWYDDYQEFTHIQYIKVSEDELPVFDICEDQEIILAGDACLNEIDLAFMATDNCTPEKNIIYAYSIDTDKDGTADITGFGNSISADFAFGSSEVSFTAKDQCGNVGECKFDLTIKDEKAPTPFCIPVSWTLGDDGSAEIWASDFDLKSFDNCTPEDELIFSFSSNPAESNRIFNCDDISNGVVEEIVIEMYVFDGSGNYDFCQTMLTLTDTNDKCEDVEGASARVGGYVSTEEGNMVKDVNIAINNMQDEIVVLAKTNNDGSFVAEGMQTFQDFMVKPYKNDDYSNGVTTLDLVLIQKHVLGTKLLTSPYKIIAADINNSSNITASDLIQLRKVILGLTEGFPNNESWRFVEENHLFPDASQPWNFPEEIRVNELFLDQMENNFVGIKVGDINNSAALLRSPNTVARNTSNLVANIDAAEFSKGQVEIPFYAQDLEEILGFQFSLSALGYEITGIKAGSLSLTNNNFNLRNGQLDVSWNAESAVQLKTDSPLFYLKVKANNPQEIEELKINLFDGLKSEAYTAELEVVALNIHQVHTRFQTNNAISNAVVLQNNPNPFDRSTVISINSSIEEEVELIVRNIHGSIVYQDGFDIKQGLNSIKIQRTGDWPSGIYIYTVQGKTFSQSMKMMKK